MLIGSGVSLEQEGDLAAHGDNSLYAVISCLASDANPRTLLRAISITAYSKHNTKKDKNNDSDG